MFESVFAAEKAAEATVENTNLVIGAGVIMLALIAAAAWFACGIYFNRTKRHFEKACKRAVAKETEQIELAAARRIAAVTEEKRQLGGEYFAARTTMRDTIDKERRRAEAAEAERDEWKRKYDQLAAEAACCPAAGTRVRRGEA